MPPRGIGCTIDLRPDCKSQAAINLVRASPGDGEIEAENMAETDVEFHNNIKIRVQAQLFTGFTLISSCLANPGEVCILPAEAARYDIFFKNSATGWEIARKLDNEAKSLTLSQLNGRYVIT